MTSPDSLAQDPIPSAITVPSQKAPTADLLLKLLEACAKHKRHHESTGGDDTSVDGEINKKCQQELTSLAGILPRVEDTITVDDTRWDSYRMVHGTAAVTTNGKSSPKQSPKKMEQETKSSNNEDVLHLCALYRAIARSSFCPHAAIFIFGGDKILPRVVRLLGYLIQDPAGASGWETAEEIGNVIAELLQLLDDRKQNEVLQDLICLANDLNTVEEAGVLFNPNNNCSEQCAMDANGSEGKIRVKIFQQLWEETIIELPSQRSLLSLQLGVWLILKQLIPKQDCSYVGSLSGKSCVDRTGITNQIIAASKQILLVKSPNDPRGGWIYSDEDARIHNLLLLRTKSSIADLLRSICPNRHHSSGDSSFTGTASPQQVTLSILAVEATKVHLIWNSSSNTLDFLGLQLNLQCSRSLANFLLSTTLTSGTWIHVLPYLVDLIPHLVNQREYCLPRVVLRILYTHLLQSNKAVTLFQRRSLARGYSTYLFQLTTDLSEHVSCAAIAIITLLLKKTGDASDLNGCFDGIDISVEITDIVCQKNQHSVRDGNKRRRLADSTPDYPVHDAQGASMHSTLVHFILESMAASGGVNASINKHSKSGSPKQSSKEKSPIVSKDLPKIRCVAGMLRILTSLHSVLSSESRVTLEGVIRRLYACISKVAQVLSSHEQEGPNHMELSVMRQSLSAIVCVGYHAYQTENCYSRAPERESMSHCAMATLALLPDDAVEFDGKCLESPATIPNDGCCHNACNKLCSVIGVKAQPPSGICLCGLGSNSSKNNLSRENGVFLVNDVLPLKFRCILLAALCPIAADSTQNDTTLTSLQRILVDASTSANVVTAALITLPTLLLSLAACKQDQDASMRYIISLMESFDFDLISRHCQSDMSSIRVAAFLSLARLNQIYIAVSTKQLCMNATSFLLSGLNPPVKRIDSMLVDMLCFEESSDKLLYEDIELPSSLSTSFKSDACKLQLLRHTPWDFHAAHLYLRSKMTTLSNATLQSLDGSAFLSNQKHYSYFDQIALDIYQNTDCSEGMISRMPLPVWVLLAPFLAPEPVASQTASSVGPILLSNHCKVFNALFATNKVGAQSAVEKLFREIEYLLNRFFRLPRAIITFGEIKEMSEEEGFDEAGLDIAVHLLKSLCQSAPVDVDVGRRMFQQSFLRLIRIWVAGTSTKYSADTMYACVFSVARDAIKYSFAHMDQSADMLSDGAFAASVFREFFLPVIKDSSSPWSRYQLLVEFFEACLIPNNRTHGQPGVDVPNSFEVGRIVDELYPSVITSMILDEDIQGLEMCAAFRMYVVNELKTQEKKQKRSGDEFVVGKLPKKKRPVSFARDLVAGVRLAGSPVSAKALTENMKMLCWKSHVIEYVLPKLLLHSDRAALKFFTELCPPDMSLSQILREKEQTVLKTLVWELGVDDPKEDTDNELYGTETFKHSHSRNSVVLALKMGYLIKEGHLASPEAEDDTTSAQLWIGPNFLYLLVNVVLYRWKSRSDRDKFRTMKCLKAMMRFLPSEDSLKFMPQVMVAISNAMGSVSSNAVGCNHAARLRYLAVSALFDFVKVLATHQVSNVEDHLTSIVVLLFPLFDDKVAQDDIARVEAVNMLLWLADKASSSFGEIPFLPVTPDLQAVRDVLADKNVFIDDSRLISQHGDHDETDPAERQSRFYAQMNILSDLIATHENKEVRKVVIQHMTKLIRSNRGMFIHLIENESLVSMRFLTVLREKGVPTDNQDSINGGFITKLMMRLLSRCVDESDRDIRDALACCLGEIGAIDSNRLGNEITFSQFTIEDKDRDDWRLNQPPWKSSITRYQLHLVIHILVRCLKSASSIIDQHKIGFGIQELLKQINATSIAGHSPEASTLKDKSSTRTHREMSSWLKDKLNEAEVLSIVEPFWTSDYQQQDISAERKPPYFSRSNSYFRWLSSLSRFLVTKSHANENSLWRDMFHGCRSAIRSQAGIDVAEFILPVLVLDMVCFGEIDDQNTITNEFLSALSFEEDSSSMQPREREKAVNAVFATMDIIRLWTEREIEQMLSPKKPKRNSRQSRKDNHGLGSWPVEESISKINHFLKRIPSSMCAQAASAVGMNARALRFLEIESRSKCGLHVAIPSETTQEPKYLKSQYIDGIDLDLTQVLLGKLSDFDTMIAISQKNRHHKSSLAKRLAEEASERELYGDIEGSCQAYEQLLDTRLTHETETDNRVEAQQGLLRCLLKLGKLESVLNQAYGMSSKNTDNDLGISGDFLPFATEAAWRLGNWSVLEQASDVDLETIDQNNRHQLCLGRVMHAIQSNSAPKFVSAIHEARESVMTSLTSAARDSYSQCYPHLMQLHALQEVEHASRGLLTNAKIGTIDILSEEWISRLNLSSPHSTGSNVIVDTRLALCRMINEPIAEGSLWLDIGKGSRKVGLFQVAEKCLTHADVAFCSISDKIAQPLAQKAIGKVKLQLAKLKYALGETTSALSLIENDMPSSVFQLHNDELKSFVSRSGQSVDTIARLLLQATEWMVADGLKSGSEVRNRYTTVLTLVPKWERAHFHFGKWLDMLYESSITKYTGQSGSGVDNNASRANAISNDEKCQQLLIDSINHYAVALHLGQKHVYQALPRLLAMWTEFTAISEDEQAANLTKNQSEANRLIKSFIPKIPEHLFYTALPQLVSCVLHSNKDTARNVMQILITVLSKYPCQTLWSCNWLRFSKSEEKQKAGNDIFNGAKKSLLKSKGGKELQSMLDASKELYKFLIQLAKYTNTNATTIKMKDPKFVAHLTTFIPPIQSALSVTPGALDRSDVNEVFPQFVPRMRAFNLEVKIMQSKAKPKRVSALAVPATATKQVEAFDEEKDDVTSLDIGEMHFLVKQEAKGDLRKDSRVQDLNNVINRLLASRKASSGSESRRQRLRLHLRTFSVVCLTEDCGILEWVPNTDSFRSLIGRTYNPQVPPSSDYRHGSRITNYNNITLRDAFMKCQDMYFKKGDLIGAAQKFDKTVLRDYPPFMYWWFVQNFPNPHAWFEARNSFTLSTAVWSAVGHVIGLGDRHSENILIDTKSGECVHVDFDCIFDKGLLLPRPEVIPFRLTPNMVDAFGPTGADGLYTGALVESMKTLRQNKDTLLSVLEPFLKDPVINFSSSKNQQKAQTASAKAVDAIRKIDGRLNGMYNLTNPNYKKVTRRDGGPQEQDDSANNIALSVEGQVQRMIAEATSHENLVQVYVGWMPWI